MKNVERYNYVTGVVHDIRSTLGEFSKSAILLEDECDYKNFADRARYVMGIVEQLAHDLFQANLKDNA